MHKEQIKVKKGINDSVQTNILLWLHLFEQNVEAFRLH